MPSITLTLSAENAERVQRGLTKAQGRDFDTDPVTMNEVKQMLIAYIRNEIKSVEEADALAAAQALVDPVGEPDIT
jgi:hypothetical protein